MACGPDVAHGISSHGLSNISVINLQLGLFLGYSKSRQVPQAPQFVIIVFNSEVSINLILLSSEFATWQVCGVNKKH
jgi:hypothetical protein